MLIFVFKPKVFFSGLELVPRTSMYKKGVKYEHWRWSVELSLLARCLFFMF